MFSVGYWTDSETRQKKSIILVGLTARLSHDCLKKFRITLIYLMYTYVCTYTVSELEVTNYKRLEMIEILNNCCISCLYLQEYKKGFAFLTKFRYFNYRGGFSRALKMQLKFFSQTIGLTQNIFF